MVHLLHCVYGVDTLENCTVEDLQRTGLIV